MKIIVLRGHTSPEVKERMETRVFEPKEREGAEGDHLIDSDVDILIVSKNFEGVNWLKRIMEVSLYWDGLVTLEPICYTPAEFEEKKKMIGIVNEAVREGVDLRA